MQKCKQKIILIVGASGAGKDTLLRNAKENLKNDLEYNFITRFITRKPDIHENNMYLDNEEFTKLRLEGKFASAWSSHGYKYAIAKEDIKNKTNIISVSRSSIGDFEREFENVIVVEIKIPEKLLFERLKLRARENEEEITKRIAQNSKKFSAKKLIIFDNSQDYQVTSKEFLKLLKTL